MTSKLTREQLHERARENVKALKMASRQTAFESAREEILADLPLSAMASEPVAVCIVEDGQMCPDGFGECDHSLPDGTHELFAAPQPTLVVLKDHQIRELVNQLRDIAIEYHGTQQLRERIARVLRAAMLNGGKS